jgi:hypothetical protein
VGTIANAVLAAPQFEASVALLRCRFTLLCKTKSLSRRGSDRLSLYVRAADILLPLKVAQVLADGFVDQADEMAAEGGKPNTIYLGLRFTTGFPVV